MSRARPPSAIFGWPLTIFALGIAGLVIALTGDGWRDAAAWAGLSVPLFAVARALRTPRA